VRKGADPPPARRRRRTDKNDPGRSRCTASILDAGSLGCDLSWSAGQGKIAVRVCGFAVVDRDPGARLAGLAGPQPGIQGRGDPCATNTTGGCDVGDRVAGCGAALVMEVGPPGPLMQGEVRNHRRLLR